MPDIPTLHALYAPALRAYVSRRIPRDDVDDILQDVWERALRASYVECGRSRAWLYTIAYGRIVDYWRYQRRHPVEVLGECGKEDGDSLAVDDMLLPLTTSQRRVLWLRFVGGYTVAETAGAMGASVVAVKALQWRGVQALRRDHDVA